jgi:hypothetical protein
MPGAFEKVKCEVRGGLSRRDRPSCCAVVERDRGQPGERPGGTAMPSKLVEEQLLGELVYFRRVCRCSVGRHG